MRIYALATGARASEKNAMGMAFDSHTRTARRSQS